MDTMAKLYDIVINRRLSNWYRPDREQAGAQKGRGCKEHIVSLRLLIDLARKKLQKLYIIFVTYDNKLKIITFLHP